MLCSPIYSWGRAQLTPPPPPPPVQAVTAGVIAAIADLLAQRISRRRHLNWRRTLSIALYGLVWGGPSNHYWQLFLERAVPRRRGGDALRPVKKMLLDQTTYGPLSNVLFMLWVALVVEGRSWSATRTKVAADYPGVQLQGWRLWPASTLASQALVPLKLRVLWNNGVALVWSTYLITRARTAGSAHRLPLVKHAHAQ
jgi:peroxisomal membrane protein 2